MSSKPPSTIFRDAADELANEFARRQFRDSITDRDAAEYVTAAVGRAWIDIENSTQSAQYVLAELVAKLTDAEATNLLRALLQQDGIPALSDLSGAFHAQVAHDLAYEAEQIVANMEPSDDEACASYSGWVDDPVAADRRTLARQFTAAARVGRLGQFDV